MALQYIRPLLRGSRAVRPLPPCLLRAYTTETTSSTSTSTSSSQSQDQSQRKASPRWSQTPPAMKARFPISQARNPHNRVWSVNSDPARLDGMYNRLLGPGGCTMLPEELKWLAVTHKSFDQGRRGFNDKLALMGRLTLAMEATKDIVSQAPLEGSRQEDDLPREPFQNEQLAQVDNLNVSNPRDVVGKEVMSEFATRIGLAEVVRWKPRLTKQLRASGIEVVLNGAIMAIIGAITLQHGSVVAASVVRERILPRLSRSKQ
ncbi:hypothetical protein E4U58_001399 [Claviceps cyperi]|nr:hypothetical protein E4U58_001399 [Claviceps cyperi]